MTESSFLLGASSENGYLAWVGSNVKAKRRIGASCVERGVAWGVCGMEGCGMEGCGMEGVWHGGGVAWRVAVQMSRSSVHRASPLLV